ncbi:MAG TPA: HXXEE domain-containing protein [Acidobacteriota bacterium]|nr:HXXEE domain-containing protein [Acidobacteriota bacterium]
MGKWVWLYPFFLAVHIVEEWAAQGGYAEWLASRGGTSMSQVFFLGSTGAGLLVMAAVVARFRQDERFQWPLMTLAFFYLANACAHLAEWVLTAAYSPGSLSGVLLWVPLAVFTIHRLRRTGQGTPMGKALITALLAQGLLTLSLWHPLLG